MSKIYNKYLELKSENAQKLYLFHSGKFYIFIADDADYINQYVVLKKTKFTNEVLKCGFPDDRYDDYMRVFQNHKLDISVIETSTIEESNLPSNIEKRLQKIIKIESILQDITIDTITPLESLEILNQIMRCIRG